MSDKFHAELDRIAGLADAATEGPWDHEDTHDGCCGSPCTENGCHESHPTGCFYILGPDFNTEYGDPIPTRGEPDAAFIADARTSIPKMARMIRAMERVIEAQRNVEAARLAVAFDEEAELKLDDAVPALEQAERDLEDLKRREWS